MQVKDYSIKVLRFQQITDASFLFSKGLQLEDGKYDNLAVNIEAK